jgi:D-psicose/D-tagatose/L-ribulose 3-epimerase
MSLRVTFAVSTWLWTSPFSKETERLFPKIKEMGFDAVEIPVEDPALIDIVSLKQALQSNGLQGIVCGAFGPGRDLTHDDQAYHKTCLCYLLSCFEIAQGIGAGFVAGPMYSAVGKARLVPEEQRKVEWDRAVRNLYKVCMMARDHGVKIALEPLNRFESDLVNTAADVMRLVRDINHPAANVLLDGFHMNIEEADMEEAVKLVADKLIHVQVSENYRGTPGSGQSRWDKLKRGLEAIGYEGAISIESFTPNVKELAGAVCIWRPLASSQDGLAMEGLRFLKSWSGTEHGTQSSKGI